MESGIFKTAVKGAGAEWGGQIFFLGFAQGHLKIIKVVQYSKAWKMTNFTSGTMDTLEVW